MTNTLVERLRAAAYQNESGSPRRVLLVEVADRLERLDAALLHDEKEIARAALVIEAARHGCVDACEIDHHAYHCPIDIALAALDGRAEDLSKNWTDFSFDHAAEDFKTSSQHIYKPEEEKK